MPPAACTDYRDLPDDESFSHGSKISVSDGVGAENLSFSMITFDPGEGGPRSYHAEPVEELYFVVSGRFEIELDDDVFAAEPGWVAYIPPGVRHRPTNTADGPSVLLVVQSPPAEHTTYVDG